jgi:hypothetical protein
MVNKRARAFDYRDERGLVFDEDLEVLACDRPSCGELRLGGVRTERVNRVLERLRLERKQAAARHFVDTAEREFPDVPRAVWEDTFGLSRGYLSRVLAGKRLPDTPLEMLLEGFAREPRLALALVKITGRLPPQLDAVMVRRHGAGWGRKG